MTTTMSLTRLYLFTYNALNLTAWAACTLYAVYLLSQNSPLPDVFDKVYHPLLTGTQSLAVLEILHSLFGIVRAPVVTTLMQVASRVLVVWGVMFPFGYEKIASGGGIVGGAGVGAGVGAGEGQLGDYAFLGCLGAWGVTECIRYGFFALQVSGLGVPAWWAWLRYASFSSPWW